MIIVTTDGMLMQEIDGVLQHYGVLGMKWGVRKDRGSDGDRRTKAQSIVRTYENSTTINKRDLADAKWMSQSITKKTANAVVAASIPQVINVLFVGARNGLSKGAITEMISKIALATAARIAAGEISGRAALKRYDASGKQDTSKKQYKRNAITPNRVSGTLVKGAISMAPIFAKLGGTGLKYATAKHNEAQARVDNWGGNLLPEPGKTSQMHTIYDDGYMSVLENIYD